MCNDSAHVMTPPTLFIATPAKHGGYLLERNGERSGLTFLRLHRIKRLLSTEAGAVGMTSRSVFSDVRWFFPRRAIRAFMYSIILGSNVKKLNKIPSLGVDAVAIDLEDGVAMNQKVLTCLQML